MTPFGTAPEFRPLPYRPASHSVAMLGAPRAPRLAMRPALGQLTQLNQIETYAQGMLTQKSQISTTLAYGAGGALILGGVLVFGMPDRSFIQTLIALAMLGLGGGVLYQTAQASGLLAPGPAPTPTPAPGVAPPAGPIVSAPAAAPQAAPASVVYG